MGETERSPHISLEIDQEIFVDAVQDGDVIDDATVATEVTSFDRVGDAYILEGAIVFAGFMDRGKTANSGADVYDDEFMDALSISDDSLNAEQLHQRVPFVLRVPVKSQNRGIVNVASRISEWKLEVISAGWIRILGDLTIVGLSSAQGYHFQCGAQEDGDLFFKESVKTVEVEAPPAFVARGDVDTVPYTQEGTEDIVAANHSVEHTPDFTKDQDPEPSDLKRLDRMFEEADTKQQAVASFEFEDHVSDLSEPSTPVRANDDAPGFLPSQSFYEDGFRASFGKPAMPPVADPQAAEATDVAAGPVPFRRAETNADINTDTSTNTDADAVVVPEGEARSTDPISIRDNMWSFVDFDGPEETYTLRYVIVDREASLDDLAAHFGCSKSELVRANPFSPDDILHPGQPLAVPDRR